MLIHNRFQLFFIFTWLDTVFFISYGSAGTTVFLFSQLFRVDVKYRRIVNIYLEYYESFNSENFDNMNRVLKVSLLLVFFAFVIAAFGYKTRNVIIIVIDGSRYTETFGDSTHQYIPRMWNDLRPLGTIYTRFYNDGFTYTVQGHSTILTGKWADNNDSIKIPTVFECYRKELNVSAEECFVILGKPKLNVLATSNFSGYGSAYGASTIYSDDYTNDIKTWNNIQKVFTTYHPRLSIVNLGQVDAVAHTGYWDGYLSSVRQADSIVGLVWNLLQSDQFYKDNTTLIVTNDHGRHSGAFHGHGDACEGCRHILCMILGPDTRAGIVDSTYRQQIDIAPTVGNLLQFFTPFSTGNALVPMISPAVPALELPPNNADNQPLSLLLKWESISRASSYRIQVAKSPDFLHPLIDDSTLTKSFKSLSFLSTGTQYYWRVEANNKGGSRGWSEVRSFTTGFNYPPELELLQPDNSSNITCDSVTVIWNTSNADVQKYWLEIGTDPHMKRIIHRDSSLTTTWKLLHMNRNKTTFWWWVRAYTSNGWTEWSGPNSFHTDIPIKESDPEAHSLLLKRIFSRKKCIQINYNISTPALVNLMISDLQGRIIKSLQQPYQKPGFYSISVDLPTLSSGCYILDFSTGRFTKRMKIIL